MLDAAKKSSYDAQIKDRLAAKVRQTAKPIVQAKPLITPIQAEGENPATDLGFVSLVESSQQRSRATNKQKRASAGPLVALVGAAMLIAAGVTWAVISGGTTSPVASITPPTRTPAEDDGGQRAALDTIDTSTTKVQAIAGGSGHQDVTNDAARDEESGEPTAVEVDPTQTAAGDSAADGSAMTDGDTIGDSAKPDDHAEASAQRSPVPDEAAVKAATAEIQKVFKDDYAAAKKPAERLALAQKLLDLAAEPSATADYLAMLAEVRQLAVSAAAPRLALEAIDRTAAEFEVDRLDLVAAVCEQFASRALPAAAAAELVEAVPELVAEAQRLGRFTTGAKIVAAVQTVARKAKLADAVKQLAQAGKRLNEAAKLTDAAMAARQRLAENPNDAAAHLAQGKYLCIVLGDWDKGVAQLAQGSDAVLKQAAELEGADAATNPVGVGDAWWDAAEPAKGIERDAARTRAGFWYRQVDDPIGLNKTKVAKRLAELDESAVPSGTTKVPHKSATSQTAVAGRKPAAAVPEQPELFLTDLKPKETQLWGLWTLQFEKVFLDGKPSPHGITTHPDKSSTAKVVYELPEGYRWFLGTIGINDIEANGYSLSPLTYHIFGDGQELWRSRPHALRGDVETFEVDVQGVKQLVLTVDCPGDHAGAHAAWGEPRLIAAPVRATKPKAKSAAPRAPASKASSAAAKGQGS